MSFDEIIINVSNVSKRYEIYSSPRDRLKQIVLPALYKSLYCIRNGFMEKHNYKPPQYFREFWALHDVSFKVHKGETLGIIGLNGSGKSTLLQIICSTLAPTLGETEVKGRVSALLELGSGFNPDFTGRENIYLNGQILGLSREDIEVKFDAIESFADIGDFIDQPVKTYSSGMVVRLAFSVAVHVDPEILVVDEALAVGDMPFQIKCFAHLRKLKESGSSILFVSHDISTVRTFCDRAIYLDHGRIFAIGSANEVCKQYVTNSIRGKFSHINQGTKSVTDLEANLNEKKDILDNQIFALLQDNRKEFLDKKHEGSQSVSLEAFTLVDSGNNIVESIAPKQLLTAYALIKFNKKIQHDLHFSIQIHNRQGMPLMVVRDSTFDDMVFGEESDMFVITMSFSLPLQQGQYYFKTGILLLPPGQKYINGQLNFEQAEVADLVEHAMFVRILPYKHHPIPVPVLNETKMKLMVINDP